MIKVTQQSGSRIGNGLSLLANKCAANTFDISSGMVYASMRDQIVRAQLLITDLHRPDSKRARILIVGAGIAGVTAAICAAELGMEVVVLESENGAFQLQRGVTERMVGPFMYEWPSVMSESQSYPPLKGSLASGLTNSPTWNASSPISADDLAKQLVLWYDSVTPQYPDLRFCYEFPAELTRNYVQEFVDAYSSIRPAEALAGAPELILPSGEAFMPDYIVLAVGMGTERTHLIDGTSEDENCVKGKRFWENDDFKSHKEMDWDVGVFGGGDGALQDVLRLVTNFNHPLQFIDALEAAPDSIADDLDVVLGELDSVEQQSRLLLTWSTDVYDLIDLKCQGIAARLMQKPSVISKVMSLIRPGKGTVTHVHRGKHFAKAYLLNRFCVHLIEFCMAHQKPPGKVEYVRIKEQDATAASKNASGQTVVHLSGGDDLTLDKVAVRFGPNKMELEKRQIIKLSPGTRADRTSMSSIPLPYVVAP